jgi:hypothetical protein
MICCELMTLAIAVWLCRNGSARHGCANPVKPGAQR